MRLRHLLAAALLLAAGPLARAQDEPLAAGSDGVPVPKKTKHVQPTYPAEALAQGVRGIVILDVVVDARGKVESASIVRSVPGLDEAAIAAVRQWEYEPTKVDGQPVRVKVTVPITFSLALPRLDRQTGIPELRQGVTPPWPAGATGGGLATAEVTLEPDGRVGVAQVADGGPPWSDALLAALRTWRFSPPPEDETLSFRVEAEFAPAGGGQPQRVNLRATGLQRSDLLAGGPVPEPPATPAPAQASPGTAPPPVEPAASPGRPAVAAPTPAPQSPAASSTPPPTPPPAPPSAPTPAPPSTPPPAPSPSVPPLRDAAPAASAPQAAPAVRPAAAPPAADPSAPPPVEVLTAPPPSAPPENGVSAIRDVTLEPGVPDLTRGRRPAMPPLARMTGTSGTVEVSFSVSAGGVTAVQAATGPDLLRLAAEQAVASWVFRRTRADRAYLVAVFTFGDDKGRAVVRPQPAVPAQP
jgi:TonB family protein